MAKKPQTHESKESQRQKLNDDLEDFLKRGGEIDYIKSGVTGIDSAKPGGKHITIGTPKKS